MVDHGENVDLLDAEAGKLGMKELGRLALLLSGLEARRRQENENDSQCGDP
jgi:hypothetical protein